MDPASITQLNKEQQDKLYLSTKEANRKKNEMVVAIIIVVLIALVLWFTSAFHYDYNYKIYGGLELLWILETMNNICLIYFINYFKDLKYRINKEVF